MLAAVDVNFGAVDVGRISVHSTYAFLESLKEKYHDIDALLLLPEKCRNKIKHIEDCGYKIRYIPLASVRFGLNRDGLQNLLGVLRRH